MVNRNIIEDLLLEVSVYHPIINFQEKEQVETLIWICEQKGHQNLIPFIKETFLNEASAGEEAKKRGLVHLGRGYYGKEKGKPATFKTEKGKLVAVKPGEETPAAKTEPIVKGEPTPKDVKPNKEKDLTATEKPLETPTQSDDTEIDSQKAKKDHDTAIEDPEKILNDPQASMRSKAVARSQQSKNAVTQADAPSKDSDAKGEFKPNPELQPQTDEKGNVAGTEIPTEVKENPDPEFVGKIATKMDEFGEKVIAEEERAQQSVIDQMKKEGKLPADFKTVGGREMGFGFKHPALKDNPELQKELGDRIKKENKPPHWNLCEVSIPGTNKFCDENIGIPRDKMPQLSGKPKPGSAGEAKAKKVAEEKVKKKMGISIDQPVPDDRKAEYDELYSKENISHVNVEQEFEDELKAQGIAVSPPVEVPASSLKATQSELVGEQVVGMVDALEEDPNNPFITAPIMVTKDGYVIDGHHRWAAIQAYNMKHAAPNGSKPPIAMKVRIVDEDIETHIPRANAFAEKMGIETMSGKAKGGAEKAEPVAAQKVSEPEEKKTEKPKEGDEYSKGTHDYRPKEEPKVTNDKLGAKAKTQGGKILYHIGGGYYSDTPGGTAKYIRVESVVEKAIESDSPNWWKLLFEADVKGSVEGGEEGLFRPIPKGQQDAATKHGKKEAEKQSQSTDGTGEVPSPQPSQTTQEPEKVAPKSMKDAIFTHSKEKNDEKKQQTIEKKLEQSNQQLLKTAQKSAESAKKKGVRTKKGVIYLETEPGSGKFQEYNVKDVYTSLNKLLNGEKLLKSDIRNLNGVVKLVTNPENGEVKIYFAAKFVGRHPQQGYESVQLASAKNFEMASAIREFAKSKGLNVGKSSEGALGKKVLTPLKFGQSINPNNPSKPVEIKQTPNGVSVDGNEIKKLKEPNEEKLVQKLISKGLSEEDARQQAKKAVLQTRAFNQRLDDLVAAANNPENETPGMIPMVNFGDVTTPEGRKQTIDNIINGTINRFESELDKFAKQFGKDDLKSKPENQKIFSTLDELKKMNQTADLQNDEAARERYKKLLDQLLLDMANADDFKDSVADFAEMKVGLQLLAEGKRVYFPASENFTVADLIVMPDTTNITPKEGQSIEDVIAENLRFYAVTVTYVGGLSVKYKGGGGSANWDKIQQSEYKNPKTKDILLGIQSVYGLAYPAKKSEQNNISDKAITEYEAKIVQALDFAVKEGIISREEAEIIKQNGFEAANSTLNGALKDVPSCADKKGKKNFRKAVQMHHIMLQLTAVINNKDVLYTRFSNFNEEIKENSEGMAIGVIDDVADGVTRPCYMNPHHNPGFKISTDPKTGCINGAPTNQNPSHIESEMPKNLLKPKQKKSKKKSVREMIQSLPTHIKERIANRLKEKNGEMNSKVEKLKELIKSKIKKKSLDETSFSGGIESDGEPPTGQLPDGKVRVLDSGKPENWFRQGSYKQLEKPKADKMRVNLKGKDKEAQFRRLAYKVQNVKSSTLKPVNKEKGVDKWIHVKVGKSAKPDSAIRYWDLEDNPDVINKKKGKKK